MTGELITTANTYDVGRIAINNAFSAETSFNSLSANSFSTNSFNVATMNATSSLSAATFYSGSTELSIVLSGSGGSGIGADVEQVLQQDGAGDVSWDLDLGYIGQLTLTGQANSHITITNPEAGRYGTLMVKKTAISQSANTVTIDGSKHFISNGGCNPGVDPCLPLTVNPTGTSIDIATFMTIATGDYFWNVSNNFN